MKAQRDRYQVTAGQLGRLGTVQTALFQRLLDGSLPAEEIIRAVDELVKRPKGEPLLYEAMAALRGVRRAGGGYDESAFEIMSARLETEEDAFIVEKDFFACTDDPYWRGNFLAKAFVVTREVPFLEAARTYLQGAVGTSFWEKLCLAVVEAEVFANNIEGVGMLVSGLRGLSLDEGLLILVRGRVSHNLDVVETRRIIEGIEDPSLRAMAWAAYGDLVAARDTINSIRSPHRIDALRRVKAYAAILAASKGEQIDLVSIIGASFAEQSEGWWLPIRLEGVRGLVAVNKIDGARKLIEDLTDPYTLALAYALLFEATGNSSDFSTARNNILRVKQACHKEPLKASAVVFLFVQLYLAKKRLEKLAENQREENRSR